MDTDRAFGRGATIKRTSDRRNIPVSQLLVHNICIFLTVALPPFESKRKLIKNVHKKKWRSPCKRYVNFSATSTPAPPFHIFMRESSYCLIHRNSVCLSVCPSVRLSVTRVD